MAGKKVAVKKAKQAKAAKGGKAAAMAPLPTPFSHFSELRQRMDRLFDEAMHGWGMPSMARDFWHLEPFGPSRLKTGLVDVRFDVSDSAEAMEITAELPGLDESDMDVTLSDGLLTVKGEKKTEREEKDKDYYLSERSFGSFMRGFRLPDSMDADKVQADFDKGVLRIIVPKRPEAKKKAKKIAVSKSSTRKAASKPSSRAAASKPTSPAAA